MTRTICIYHANCADGFTAAWAVRQALGSGVEFVPAGYGDEPPDVDDADVVIVDFSYPRAVLERMAKWARHPPSAKRVRLVLGVIALCLILVAIERWIGWPEALTVQKMRP